jgi:hypothetical protein
MRKMISEFSNTSKVFLLATSLLSTSLLAGDDGRSLSDRNPRRSTGQRVLSNVPAAPAAADAGDLQRFLQAAGIEISWLVDRSEFTQAAAEMTSEELLVRGRLMQSLNKRFGIVMEPEMVALQVLQMPEENIRGLIGFATNMLAGLGDDRNIDREFALQSFMRVPVDQRENARHVMATLVTRLNIDPQDAAQLIGYSGNIPALETWLRNQVNIDLARRLARVTTSGGFSRDGIYPFIGVHTNVLQQALLVRRQLLSGGDTISGEALLWLVQSPHQSQIMAIANILSEFQVPISSVTESFFRPSYGLLAGGPESDNLSEEARAQAVSNVQQWLNVPANIGGLRRISATLEPSTLGSVIPELLMASPETLSGIEDFVGRMVVLNQANRVTLSSELMMSLRNMSVAEMDTMQLFALDMVTQLVLFFSRLMFPQKIGMDL